MIPAFSLDADDVYIFRTAHHERLRRDWKVPLWKIALATSAAPTFLPVCTSVDGIRHIDGGVWANNPSVVAIVEATGTLGIRLSDVRLFSVGTCDPIPKRGRWLNWAGQLGWGGSGAGVDVLMKGQSTGATNQARFLLGDDRFLRLNPPVAPGEFTLNGASKAEELIARANHHSRKIVPDYVARFASHIARPFKSLYPGDEERRADE